MPRKLDPTEFWSRAARSESGCLIWTGPKSGRYGLWGRRKYAHREAYERTHGPVPAGQCVCHACDTPLCIEPSHLWSGTQFENLADMTAKGRRYHKTRRRNNSLH